MQLIKNLIRAREVSIKHLDELGIAYYGHIPNKKAVICSLKTLMSKDTAGGSNFQDTDQFLAVDQHGWLTYTATVECGQFVPNNFNVLDEQVIRLSDEEVEKYFNSFESTPNEFLRFIEKYNEIASKYPNELEKISNISNW
ncbi:hypothetical protein [Brevibacillus porteri]|uniref:hypothetical protein n=1 Tax=Brevibacillus porteri TaxID=2126350 RepID=UPI00370C1655